MMTSDDIDPGENRFKNFVLMIGEEVIQEMKKDFTEFDSKLRHVIMEESTASLIKISVVKTMLNLQTKHAYTAPFMEQMIGKELMDRVKE